MLATGSWHNPATAQTSWRGLMVAPESRCSPYDADDYRYPQSVENRIVAELGDVYGPYTGRWFANKRETDIEHIVARSEAHDSGLCAADEATRRRLACHPARGMCLCLLFIHPRAPNLISLRSTGTMPI